MSLINEALKKAQRQRHEETGEAATAAPLPVLETAPAAPAGEAVPVRRGKTSGANTLLLIGSGAVVLVVLSVVVTFVLLNRASPSAPATAVATARPAPVAPPPAARTPVESPAPPLTPPVSAPAVVTAPVPVAAAPAAVVPAAPAAVAPAPTPAPAPAPTIPTPPAVASAPAVAVTPPAPVAAAPAVSTPALPTPEAAPPAATPAPVAGPAKPDERIARFVEAIKVTGIRSSGAESRVLMNDRVYRVNDTVERTLGVKLTKVEADQLTFVDANGLTYVKGL